MKPPKNLFAVRRKLLRWYDQNHRDLPWRRVNDPYAIWVAETMLQQTQVATVTPYYERFLETFPTIEALHRAPLAKVLTLWSGLGYYRRAHHLKAAARVIVRRHAGRIPAEYDTLLALPGVGAYTAGALMSIAFHQPYPAVDGNARRVLARLFDLKNEKSLRATAAKLVPGARPGRFNQGLMELGATLCAPKAPRCGECPVAADCAARRNHPLATALRAKTARALRRVTWPLAIVRKRARILLRRRSNAGILPGLWELPGGALERRESIRACLEKQLSELNGTVSSSLRLGEVHHSITNRKIRAPVFLIDVSAETDIRAPGRRWRWLPPSSFGRYPVSSMTLKAAKILAAYGKSSL